MFGSDDKFGAICAFAGGGLLFLGTFLHPMQADPNNALAAFAEYAADRTWVTAHLLQFAGFAMIVAAMVVLGRQVQSAHGTALPRLATGGAVASLAVAAALQAVDGIALKAVVDAWAAAPAEQKDAAFHAAFAVRQIEIGLASLLAIVFGFAAGLYGAMLWNDRSYPMLHGRLAAAGGIASVLAGVVMAYTGFSPRAMTILMLASLALIAWIAALGAVMWRRANLGE